MVAFMTTVTHEYSIFTISTDASRLDIAAIHRELASSYWAQNIPRATVEKSIRHSLCFGAYDRETCAQIGFARVITDYATFVYVCDVYVTVSWRGRGVSKALMEAIMAHPELQGMRRYCLGTRDAHGLYARYGFEPVKQPANWMEIKRVAPYGGLATSPS